MSFMEIADGNAMQFFADDVLFIASGFACFVLKPHARFLREFGAEIKWSGRHYASSFTSSSIEIPVIFEIEISRSIVGRLWPCTHSQTVGCETPMRSAS